MSAVSIAWQNYTLSPAAEDIGEILEGAENGLPGLGYTDIASNSAGNGSFVTCQKGDFRVIVSFWFLGDRNFVQTATCFSESATDESQTDPVNGEVINLIDNLVIL